MDNISEPVYSYQPKPVELVYEPERIKILLDETRKDILRVLAEPGINDLSVTDIADRLGTNPQRIYHHVDKLVEHNFIVKTREERKKRSITSFYSRTARAFVVSYSSTRNLTHEKEMVDTFVTSFNSILQLNLDIKEEKLLENYVAQLVNLSEDIFSEISKEGEEIDEKRKIEHLYFLLEYYIFYTHPEAREIIHEIRDLLVPKILERKDTGVKTVKF